MPLDPETGNLGTVRWGSDWTFNADDWWSEIPRPSADESYIYRTGAPDEWSYFFADPLADWFFPYPLSEDFRDLWIEPWTPLPPD